MGVLRITTGPSATIRDHQGLECQVVASYEVVDHVDHVYVCGAILCVSSIVIPPPAAGLLAR